MSLIYLAIFLSGMQPKTMMAENIWPFQTMELTINVKNIKTKKGVISIGIFKDHASFENEKPYKVLTISKSKVVNGVIRHKLHLPKGTYGLAALDDTNNNGDMDYNFFGYPLEGFGFSNYFHSGLSSPKFKDFLFSFTKNKTVDVKLKYM